MRKLALMCPFLLVVGAIAATGLVIEAVHHLHVRVYWNR